MEVENYLLTKNDFELCTTGAFKNLLNETEFVDVTLACPDEKQIDAHKVVLSACSPFFKKILLKNKKKDQLIYLKGILSRDLMSILQFMYTGQTKVCKENLDCFLLAAQELQVEGLVYSEIGQSQGKEMKGKDKLAKEKHVNFSKLIEDEVNKKELDDVKIQPPPVKKEPKTPRKEPKTPRKVKASNMPLKPDFKCEECQLYLQNQNHFDVHNEMLHKKAVKPRDLNLKTEPIDDSLNITDTEMVDVKTNNLEPTVAEGEKDFSCETDGCEFVTKHRNDLKAHILSLHLGLKKYSQQPIPKESEGVEVRASSPDSEDEINGGIESVVDPTITKPKTGKSDNEKRFCCEICDFGTAHKFNLKRHMNKVHQMLALDNSVSDKYTDEEILEGDVFMDEAKKKKRTVGVDLENTDPSQIFSCDRCDFQTTHIKSIRRHKMVIHEGLRHPCNYCSFQATQPYDVKKHMLKRHPDKM